MENFFSRIRRQKIMFKLPKKNEIEMAILSFSKKEWLVFFIFALGLLISTVIILGNINKYFMVSVPVRGGSIAEGIVGTPRFINPVLAISDADRDLVSLIYSGLMRKTPDGTLFPDLAEKVEVSKNGLSYTFTLKDKLSFQDGKPLTVDDIIFTINAVKDPIIRSPRKGDWDGITVIKIDNKTVKFTLKQPYATFLENATLGIMPEHIWKNSSIELNDANTNPIGEGPYQVLGVNKQSSGSIDYYNLEEFKNFSLGEPYIKNLSLHFYSNEDNLVRAFENKEVDQISSITPEQARILEEKNYDVQSSVLPRIFGLFFNQNQNQIFTDKHIAEAIDKAIDKNKIVQVVLGGYGVGINAPIPPNIIVYQTLDTPNTPTHAENLKTAQDILAKDGWKIGVSGFLEKTTTVKKKKTTLILAFSISTGNASELSESAELIRQDLTAIGMKVDVKTFEVGNLNQSVIRPRKYDALLFGQIINHESDLFAFWHSSQRKDPGLNVAMYTNPKVDKILEDAFVTVDEASRIKKYVQFEDEIKKDMPAVFLYSPNFIYVASKNLKGVSIDHITSPSDRFLNVYLWYIKTENIWKVFAPTK